MAGEKPVKIKARKKNLRFKNAVAGYLFIAPFIVGFVLFMILPLGDSIRMSLSRVEVSIEKGGFEMTYVGVAKEGSNFYKAFMVDPEFRQLLVEELSTMGLEVVATIIFSFFVALLLNQSFKGRGFVRAIFFLPVILSSGVIVGLEYNNALLQGMEELIKESSQDSSITATLQDLLLTAGLGSSFYEYLFEIVDKVYDIAIASGIQIIIFLSGLQTISPSMFEAAKIEGCTAWECFWKITFPMVSSLILVNVIYTIIDFFIRTDNQVMTKISETMTKQMDYGFASAMAWIYFLCVIVIIGVVSAIISRWVYYYE